MSQRHDDTKINSHDWDRGKLDTDRIVDSASLWLIKRYTTNPTVHTRSGPRVMATLRTFAIGTIRLTGQRDITEATRCAGRAMDRSFKILKLT